MVYENKKSISVTKRPGHSAFDDIIPRKFNVRLFKFLAHGEKTIHNFNINI